MGKRIKPQNLADHPLGNVKNLPAEADKAGADERLGYRAEGMSAADSRGRNSQVVPPLRLTRLYIPKKLSYVEAKVQKR
jgi:hypothetical protein